MPWQHGCHRFYVGWGSGPAESTAQGQGKQPDRCIMSRNLKHQSCKTAESRLCLRPLHSGTPVVEPSLLGHLQERYHRAFEGQTSTGTRHRANHASRAIEVLVPDGPSHACLGFLARVGQLRGGRCAEPGRWPGELEQSPSSERQTRRAEEGFGGPHAPHTRRRGPPLARSGSPGEALRS